MKNERTSRKVSKIAGRVLEKLARHKAARNIWLDFPSEVTPNNPLGFTLSAFCTAKELKALCASALTQTADRK